jgi:hypothetical protein
MANTTSLWWNNVEDQMSNLLNESPLTNSKPTKKAPARKRRDKSNTTTHKN